MGLQMMKKDEEKEGSKTVIKKLNLEMIKGYLKAMMKKIPKVYTEFHQNHISAAYFIICSLGLLDELDGCPFTKEQIIKWVYNFQVPILSGEKPHCSFYGFRGGFLLPFTPLGEEQLYPNDTAHIANTYCALSILKMCGDDFSKVNKKEIISSLQCYQNKLTGCFQCLPNGQGNSEADVRFIYCACCISSMLNDFSGIDIDKAVNSIIKCQHYNGGFGWVEGAEAHSGLTFCSVAALKMMDALHKIEKRDALVEFLFSRNNIGWNGRIGKDPDTCYSFWNTATLSILGFDIEAMIDKSATINFLFSCFKGETGFGKLLISRVGDVVHTLYSLATLSFFPEFGLAKIDPILAIPEAAIQFNRELIINLSLIHI
eukprot:TRINITY_DN396_c0_g1_i1.p1 TRINITY_DN396_c0_g1~~TRINITY_DN396_c0_g1_i1.p1  ORF type:complete len:403 (+),score=55.73 TRINITY_DN396_c0_g1_i1:95-1210(+)